MARSNVEFKVGIVVLVGIAILAVSLYWLQGYTLERNAFRIHVLFGDVGTLAIGNRVTVHGVRKGKVQDMTLVKGGVKVDLLLSDDVALREDARFVIKNMGLMGERFVAVYPGEDSARFDTTQVARGQYDTGLPDVMGLMGEMVAELRELVSGIREHVGSESFLTKFNRTITSLEQVSASVAEYLDRNEENVDQSIENLAVASKNLRTLLANNSSAIDSTVDRFDRISRRLDDFVYRLDTLSQAARQFADRLNYSDGTLQLLMEDRRLYDDLRSTADNIDDLINDIRANPRKYINLTVEIF